VSMGSSGVWGVMVPWRPVVPVRRRALSRSQGQGWPEATPEGPGLDAGEERRTLVAPDRARAGGLGVGVQRTVVSLTESWQRFGWRGIPSLNGMVRSGHDRAGL
jgi:hypothetical protein